MKSTSSRSNDGFQSSDSSPRAAQPTRSPGSGRGSVSSTGNIDGYSQAQSLQMVVLVSQRNRGIID